MLCILASVASLGSAAAQPGYGSRPAPPPAAAWDSRGWVPLGERTVDGHVDHDRLDVGRYEGRFSKLTLVVLDSDLELIDFKIVFADNTTYDPKVSQFFREGQRTRVLDMPPAEHVIRNIDFKYRNLAGGGRAKVQVWGFKTGGATPPPPPPVTTLPVRVDWDSRGWTLLGERTVNGSVDRDRIEVGRMEGKFTKLTLVALDSDLELIDFDVKFNKGAPWHPGVTHYFREGQRTRAIDFPGDERTIKHIDFRYRNLPGGGRAKLQVWGFKTSSAPPVPVWDNRGWRLLGEQTVNGSVDRDHITVTRDEGKFRKLMIVVLDSDLELMDFEVIFAGRGRPFHPEVRQVFRENTRTRSIDLPGDRRVIQTIEFKYRNLPGGGRAKLQIWGI
jgi:hypothetical protein